MAKQLVIPGREGSGHSPSIMQRKLANPASPWDRARGATTAAYMDRREDDEEDRESIDLDDVREKLHARVYKYRQRVKNQRLLTALLTSAYVEAIEAIQQPEMNAAALKVQSMHRGRLGRQATAKKRKLKEEEEEALEQEKAATKVQSLYRGRQSRKEVEALRLDEQKAADDKEYDDDDDSFEAEDFEDDDFEADEAADGDGSAKGDESSHGGDAEDEREPELPEKEAPPLPEKEAPPPPEQQDPSGQDALAAQEAARALLPAVYASAASAAAQPDALGRAAAISANLRGVYERVLERMAAKEKRRSGDEAAVERHDGAATSFVLLVCQAGIRAAQGDG